MQVRERFLVNWALLGELKKFTEYSVRVRAFTSIGYGPENNITVLTSQDGTELTCNLMRIYALLEAILCL